MSNKSFGKILYELRMQYHVSLTELSTHLNVTEITIDLWERDELIPSEEQFQNVLSYFESKKNSNTSKSVIYDDSTIQKNIKHGKKRITLFKLLTGAFKKNKTKSSFSQKKLEDFDIDNFPTPYLYIIVFIACLLVFVACIFLKVNFLIIITGSIFVPISLFMFLWELNIYRNISLTKCFKLIFTGGVMSIALTLLFNSFFEIYQSGTLIGCLIVSFVEELSKILVSYYLIKKYKVVLILPAIIIGASVGVGFAIIEDMLYAYRFLTTYGYDSMLQTIILRAITTLGGHSLWAAIEAAALVMACNYRIAQLSDLQSKKFLKIAIIPFILHTLWNLSAGGYIKLACLTVINIIIILRLINAGLNEADKLQELFGIKKE